MAVGLDGKFFWLGELTDLRWVLKEERFVWGVFCKNEPFFPHPLRLEGVFPVEVFYKVCHRRTSRVQNRTFVEATPYRFEADLFLLFFYIEILTLLYYVVIPP